MEYRKEFGFLSSFCSSFALMSYTTGITGMRCLPPAMHCYLMHLKGYQQRRILMCCSIAVANCSKHRIWLNEGLPTCIHIIQHVICIHAITPECKQCRERDNPGDESKKGGL